MKGLLSGLAALSLMVAGCGKESEPGGPGASTTRTPNGTARGNGDADDNTFTLKVPSTSTNITQGEDDEVTVSIDRGSKFEQKVALAFQPAAGLTVIPETADIDRGQNDVKVRVTASPTATVGTAAITVTATPETGKAVSEKFTVDVKAASDTNRTTTPDGTAAPPAAPPNP